jgi:hypothetical protein
MKCSSQNSHYIFIHYRLALFVWPNSQLPVRVEMSSKSSSYLLSLWLYVPCRPVAYCLPGQICDYNGCCTGEYRRTVPIMKGTVALSKEIIKIIALFASVHCTLYCMYLDVLYYHCVLWILM